MISAITPEQIKQKISAKKSFIVNVVASWCPDCTEQGKHIDDFAEHFSGVGLEVYQINVQDVRNEYLSEQHKAITEQFGGHGFPRTVLIKLGDAIDTNNVEIISAAQLITLSTQFLHQL